VIANVIFVIALLSALPSDIIVIAVKVFVPIVSAVTDTIFRAKVFIQRAVATVTESVPILNCIVIFGVILLSWYCIIAAACFLSLWQQQQICQLHPIILQQQTQRPRPPLLASNHHYGSARFIAIAYWLADFPETAVQCAVVPVTYLRQKWENLDVRLQIVHPRQPAIAFGNLYPIVFLTIAACVLYVVGLNYQAQDTHGTNPSLIHYDVWCNMWRS